MFTTSNHATLNALYRALHNVDHAIKRKWSMRSGDLLCGSYPPVLDSTWGNGHTEEEREVIAAELNKLAGLFNRDLIERNLAEAQKYLDQLKVELGN